MDRMIQQAVLQILQPFFDPTFSNDSYGFRPKRSAHQAIQRAQEHSWPGMIGWWIWIWSVSSTG